MKLKYKLKLEDNIVSFRVLEMSENMRCAFRKTTTNNINFRSDASPELRPYGTVFLRGWNKDLDVIETTLAFDSKEKAAEYYNRVKFALEETFGKPSTWTVTPRRSR